MLFALLQPAVCGPCSNHYIPPSAAPYAPMMPDQLAYSATAANGDLYHWPSGADEFGLMESQDPNPNWNDYMDPDEMEQFERWQKADANDEFGEYYYGPGGEGDDDMGDIVDPAEIPLCMEYADNAMCPRGDACSLIHGDQCERMIPTTKILLQMCRKFVIHPYNPEQIEEHKRSCPGATATGNVDTSRSTSTAPAAAAPAAPVEDQQPANGISEANGADWGSQVDDVEDFSEAVAPTDSTRNTAAVAAQPEPIAAAATGAGDVDGSGETAETAGAAAASSLAAADNLADAAAPAKEDDSSTATADATADAGAAAVGADTGAGAGTDGAAATAQDSREKNDDDVEEVTQQLNDASISNSDSSKPEHA
eukprot:jgi/Chrzof1/10411/UNPLg00335.t1